MTPYSSWGFDNLDITDQGIMLLSKSIINIARLEHLKLNLGKYGDIFYNIRNFADMPVFEGGAYNSSFNWLTAEKTEHFTKISSAFNLFRCNPFFLVRFCFQIFFYLKPKPNKKWNKIKWNRYIFNLVQGARPQIWVRSQLEVSLKQ